MPISWPSTGGRTASLTEKQIAAAGALHATLEQWHATDTALYRLQQEMPTFGLEECVLKVAAIDALYGTNVYAKVRAARHAQAIIGSANLSSAGLELVESLARVPPAEGGRPQRHLSFASKFAHFFIDAERFPIYDSYAQRIVSLHLGPSAVRDRGRPYEAFVRNLDRLKSESGLGCTYRELDHYLWIAGLYRAHLGGKRELNAELRNLFLRPSTEQRVLLETLRAANDSTVARRGPQQPVQPLVQPTGRNEPG